MTQEKLQNYLERIQYKGSPAPNLASLIELQKAHLYHVPFENLDIHLHVPITMSTDRFYEKVVEKKRGGFCYELNGLFNELLCDLGFNTIQVSARAANAVGEFNDEFDHLALIVFIDDKSWLTDVGFGEFSLGPIRIEENSEQEDKRGIFRIQRFDKTYWLVQKKNKNEGWHNEYLFSEQPRHIMEFSDKCYWHQTSPESHFTQKMLCSLATEKGRITITNKALKITEGDQIVETPIKDPDEFKNTLAQYFNIELQRTPAASYFLQS